MKFLYAILCLFLAASSCAQAKGIEDAKAYHKNSELQLHAAMEFLETTPWKGSERILDVGSGDGRITAFIAKNYTNGTVVGLDVSGSMIHAASSLYPQNEYPNLHFLEGDASELPFEQQFDVVVSFSALHWVLDQEKALREILKALAPEGRAYLFTYGQSPMNLATLAEELISSEKWSHHFSTYTKQRVYFTQDEYRSLLQKAGFAEIHLTARWSETIYSHRKALIDFIRPLFNNCIGHLSQDLQQDFLEELADKITSLAKPTEDGSIHFEFLKLEVSAVRG